MEDQPMRVPIATLATVALLGCQTAADRPAAQAQKPVQAKAAQDGVQRVEVVGGSYFFKPSHIVVKVNVPVELAVSRESGVIPHNLVIKDPDGGTAVEEELSTEPKKVTFTPKKVGKYAFYCSKKPPLLASHRERGMEGVLEVVR
jgi:plastocyanin domain-containing protein